VDRQRLRVTLPGDTQRHRRWEKLKERGREYQHDPLTVMLSPIREQDGVSKFMHEGSVPQPFQPGCFFQTSRGSRKFFLRLFRFRLLCLNGLSCGTEKTELVCSSRLEATV
jgi:hypothetical protein